MLARIHFYLMGYRCSYYLPVFQIYTGTYILQQRYSSGKIVTLFLLTSSKKKKKREETSESDLYALSYSYITPIRV